LAWPRPPAVRRTARFEKLGRLRGRASGSTTRGRRNDQDRPRAVLGARPGRGARLLHPQARWEVRDDVTIGEWNFPLAGVGRARPGGPRAGADSHPGAPCSTAESSGQLGQLWPKGACGTMFLETRRLPGRLRRAVCPRACVHGPADSAALRHRPRRSATRREQHPAHPVLEFSPGPATDRPDGRGRRLGGVPPPGRQPLGRELRLTARELRAAGRAHLALLSSETCRRWPDYTPSIWVDSTTRQPGQRVGLVSDALACELGRRASIR